MKTPFKFLILLVGLTVMAGCSPSKEKETDVKDKDKTLQTEDKKAEDKDQTIEKVAPESVDTITQADQKLVGYVDCINSYSNRALMSYDRYVSWADEATGPTGNEQNIYGLYTLVSEVQPCVADLKKAKTLKPSYPALEKAAEAYSSALSGLEPLLNEADEYYTEQNFKDDAMAKGKEMHPKLIAAFKAFEAADTSMRTELEKIQDELDVKRLAQLEKTEGKKYAYLTTNSMVMAKKLVNQTDVTDLKNIKLEELQPAIENFEKSVDELKAYDATHKSELALGSSADSFINDASSLVTAAKELMRRVRDNVPFDTGEIATINAGNEAAVTGSPGNVLSAYNRLVQTSNLLRL